MATRRLHAHWNLDRGGTAPALLAACRRALIHARENRCVNPPGGSSSPGFPSRDGNDDDGLVGDEDDHVLDDALRAFRQQFLRLASTTGRAEEEEGGLTLGDLRGCLERVSSEAVGSWYTMEATVHLRDDIEEVIRCARSVPEASFLNDDAVAASALADVSTLLLCLCALGVESVSYAPLPLHPGSPPRHVERLVGLTVAPVSTTLHDPPYDDGTILFLQLLTRGSLKMLSLRDAPPPALRLVWQGSVGPGAGDADVDGTNGGASVTLTLGVASPAAASPTATAAQTSQCEDIPMGCAEDEPPSSLSSPLPLPWNVDRLVLLQTNVDDLTPEHCAFVMELVLAKPVDSGGGGGALDAWTTNIGMKKGRSSATQLSVLCSHERTDELMRLLFRHARTLGIRQQFVDRASLRRRIVAVEAPWEVTGGDDSSRTANGRAPHIRGRVDVKVGYMLTSRNEEEVVSMKPEFDHCRAVALATGAPIQSITEQALLLAKEQMKSYS